MSILYLWSHPLIVSMCVSDSCVYMYVLHVWGRDKKSGLSYTSLEVKQVYYMWYITHSYTLVATVPLTHSHTCYSSLTSLRYFESGVCSVYLWDLDHGFAGVILIKKAGDTERIKGCWDSIHVVEVQVCLPSWLCVSTIGCDVRWARINLYPPQKKMDYDLIIWI